MGKIVQKEGSKTKTSFHHVVIDFPDSSLVSFTVYVIHSSSSDVLVPGCPNRSRMLPRETAPRASDQKTRSATVKQSASRHFILSVAGSNPLIADQLPHMAALIWPQSLSWTRLWYKNGNRQWFVMALQENKPFANDWVRVISVAVFALFIDFRLRPNRSSGSNTVGARKIRLIRFC